jgi:tRNA/tmRNA/rRNA uracil-C5-methylase (TrmA/RlmC/RlmD family)
VRKTRSRSSKTIWTYAFQIEPPQTEHRLRTIKTLLEQEQADAERHARTWVGRVVREQQITHILVVSDSPEQSRDVNRRLEAEFKALAVGFSISAPMVVADHAAPSDADES